MPEAAWEKSLQQVITDPKVLLALLGLDSALLPAAIRAALLFPLAVPPGFVARMQKGNPDDPLLRQVLPLAAELRETPLYSSDPLGETEANIMPGLLHKYHGRVLLTLTGTCAINCRYCFRRHFPYKENNPGSRGWDKAIAYIANDTNINEVILSGGEPLLVKDKILTHLTNKLAAIPHLKRLRIHTRMPIVLPERISANFITWIRSIKLQTIMVVHCNHPQEINAEVIAAMQALRQANVTLLNQAVLLKGVNDSEEVLINLSESLFAAGILPYYLHLLDKVQNTAHFDLDLSLAKKLHYKISHSLPGFLVPRLAYEKAGAPAKISLDTYDLYTD